MYLFFFNITKATFSPSHTGKINFSFLILLLLNICLWCGWIYAYFVWNSHVSKFQTSMMVVWHWNMSGADERLINLSRFALDDDNLNLNLTLVDESNSLERKNYWALLLLLLCIAVVFGNVLVILSVVKVSPFSSSSSPGLTLWSGEGSSKRDESLHRILGSGRPLCGRGCHAFLCLHHGWYIIATVKTTLIVM